MSKKVPNFAQGAWTYVLNGKRYTTTYNTGDPLGNANQGYRPTVHDPVPVSEETYESDELHDYEHGLLPSIPSKPGVFVALVQGGNVQWTNSTTGY